MSDGNAVTPTPQFQFDMQQGTPPAPPVVEPPSAPPVIQAPVAPVQEPQLTEYARSLLEGVPDEHRTVLDQYVPKWDAGVERRVNMLEQQFGPVIDLINQGHSIEELATAAQLFDLASDPEQKQLAQQIMAKTFGWDQQPTQPVVQQPQPGQQPMQLPPEVQQTLAQNTQLMQQLAQAQQHQALTAQQQQEDARIEQYMGLLKQEKGVFDEDYVLNLMSQGIDGAEAVDRFNSIVQQHAQSNGGGAPITSLPAPPVLSGGPAAVGPRPVHEASDAERKALVTQMLNQANSQAS